MSNQRKVAQKLYPHKRRFRINKVDSELPQKGEKGSNLTVIFIYRC